MRVLEYIEHAPKMAKTIGDVSAISVAWAAFAEEIPAVASLLSVIWLLLQIYSWVKHKKWKE